MSTRLKIVILWIGVALICVSVPVLAEETSENTEAAANHVVAAEAVQDDKALVEQTESTASETSETPSLSERSETAEASEQPDATETKSEESATSDENAVKPEHFHSISPFAEDKTIRAELKTSLGVVSCDLFAGAHPLTVLNFMSLAKGSPTWTDASGTHHSDPYYRDLKFAGRRKNAYVMSGLREEGTNFVIADERCTSHGPVSGAIAMVQPYPGMASTQFILLARDTPVLQGMYTVFGHCGPIEVIQALTKNEAVLEEILIGE